jgi:hypothetical protein
MPDPYADLARELRDFRRHYDGDMRPAAVQLIGYALLAGKRGVAEAMSTTVCQWDNLLDLMTSGHADYEDPLAEARRRVGLHVERGEDRRHDGGG